MALDKLTKLTSNSGISTVIDYTMSDLIVDSINIVGGGTTLGKDFETRNLKVTGVSTFVGNVQMDGNLTVNGTTTTLDTNLVGVDRVEVVANDNNYAGIAVTQSGTGDIISAYDGSTQVFVVNDGNKVGIADSIYHLGDTNTAFGFPSADTFKIDTAGVERFRISSSGAAKVTGTLELTDSLYWDGDNTTTIDNAGISSTFRFKTGGTTVMDITATKNVQLKDDRQLLIGASNDLTIYHSSSTNKSYVTSATHDVIHSFNVGKPWTLQTTAADKRIHCPTTKSVELYHNGTKKFETAQTGAVVTGILTATSFVGGLPITNGADNRVITASSASAIQGESSLTFDGTTLMNAGGTITAERGAIPSVESKNSTTSSYARFYCSQTTGSGGYAAFQKLGTTSTAIGGANATQIWCTGDAPLVIGVNNGERLRIASDGDMTIGTGMHPGAALNIINSKNVETGLDDMANYHLVLKNPANDTGEAIGLAFGITDTAAKVGAAIVHERDAAGSQGSLQFFTRPDNSGPPVERFRILSGGPVIFGHSSSPTSEGDKIQAVSTSGGQGLCLHNYAASAYGNQIAFMKSRNGTIGSNTILQNGDRIGELNFYGNDGSGRSLGAQISVRISGSPGNDNTPAAMYFMNGANQSMQTRLSILPAGTVGISKNGWSTSDNSFSLTVHTGSTSDSGAPVNDGIMIVSQNSSGNQNSTTGKLMFCGHAQTNGPFLYADNTLAWGKKDLVFHTRSTANDYTTQLAETLRLTKWGFFGLGTDTNVDSLMHIQGTSDNGDTYCQLTIEDTDDTAGSMVPQIVFKGNGNQIKKIRATDTNGIRFFDANNNERFRACNDAEGGATLINADSRGWATIRHNDGQGLRTHIRQHYAPGNAVQTRDILRIRRHNWGWGTYKIRLKALYYYGSQETTYYVNGNGAGGNDNYSIVKETAHNNDWSGATVTKSAASTSSPGNSSTSFIDVRVNIPNYMYMIVYVEAYTSQYSTDPTNVGSDSYCLL